MNTFKTNGRATIYITFSDENPMSIDVTLLDKLYFFRDLGGKFPQIKFNVNHAGTYSIDTDCKTIQVKPIEITPLDIQMPEPERNRMKDFTIVYNPNLKGTPARNFSQTGVIEYSDIWKQLPFPVRLFILLHEIGHFYYKTEKYADLYAAKAFIDNGYNQSTAIYSLTKVLHESPANLDRIYSLFNNIT
jgi:hypothetical protein